MDFFERFFGRGLPRPGADPVANPRLETPLSLQLLFDGPLELDADALTLVLRAFHPELADAKADLVDVSKIDPPRELEQEEPPTLLGLVGWGKQVVKVVGFSFPMPKAPVETCVRPAPIANELKQAAFAHTSHLLLYYAGYETDPHEQYVGLAAVAAGLARLGALLVMNEQARTAIPAMALLPHDDDPGDFLQMLRALPIPILYGGCVSLQIEGQDAYWLRTFGNHLLRLPDLAFHAIGREPPGLIFEIFGHMLQYLRETGRTFEPGDTMQVGHDVHFRLRERTADEWFLESDGELLVAEAIASQTHPPLNHG